MALPFGAKYVYRALGLPIPAEDMEEDSIFPPEEFEDELEDAAIIIQTDFPKVTYPCLYDNNGNWNPTGNDLRLYERALGLVAASLLVTTSTAAPGVGQPTMVKRKLIDVEYTFKTVDNADRATLWKTEAYDIMGRVCAGDGTTGLDANAGDLFKVVNPNVEELGILNRPRTNRWGRRW